MAENHEVIPEVIDDDLHALIANLISLLEPQQPISIENITFRINQILQNNIQNELLIIFNHFGWESNFINLAQFDPVGLRDSLVQYLIDHTPVLPPPPEPVRLRDPMVGDIIRVDHSRFAHAERIPIAQMVQAFTREFRIIYRDREMIQKCLTSRNGNTYFMTRTLRDCIYGKVKHALRLVSVEPDVFTLGDAFAIKCIRKAMVEQYRGRHNEDPIKELNLMWFLTYERGGHPNVMPITEILEDEAFIYAIMPFYNGGELFSAVESAERFSLDATRHLFRQIMLGVDFLHRNMITHRDISLENTLLHNVQGNQLAVVIDFGMALRMPRTETNPLLLYPTGACGKKNYMSPEVYRNQPFDGFAIDIWACGIILFILLNGVPPFDAPDDHDPRYVMVSQGRLNELLDMWEMLRNSPNARDLLNAMLSLNPRNRPTTSQVLSHRWFQDL